jgi:hypothetical protein
MNFRSNTISAIVLATLACFGAGCTKQGEAAAPTAAESNRVLTVDEYLKQPDLRKKVFTACANDPGRKGSDANCVNALQAERIASSGTGRFPGATP